MFRRILTKSCCSGVNVTASKGAVADNGESGILSGFGLFALFTERRVSLQGRALRRSADHHGGTSHCDLVGRADRLENRVAQVTSRKVVDHDR